MKSMLVTGAMIIIAGVAWAQSLFVIKERILPGPVSSEWRAVKDVAVYSSDNSWWVLTRSSTGESVLFSMGINGKIKEVLEIPGNGNSVLVVGNLVYVGGWRLRDGRKSASIWIVDKGKEVLGISRVVTIFNFRSGDSYVRVLKFDRYAENIVVMGTYCAADGRCSPFVVTMDPGGKLIDKHVINIPVNMKVEDMEVISGTGIVVVGECNRKNEVLPIMCAFMMSYDGKMNWFQVVEDSRYDWIHAHAAALSWGGGEVVIGGVGGRVDSRGRAVIVFLDLGSGAVTKWVEVNPEGLEGSGINTLHKANSGFYVGGWAYKEGGECISGWVAYLDSTGRLRSWGLIGDGNGEEVADVLVFPDGRVMAWGNRLAGENEVFPFVADGWLKIEASDMFSGTSPDVLITQDGRVYVRVWSVPAWVGLYDMAGIMVTSKFITEAGVWHLFAVLYDSGVYTVSIRTYGVDRVGSFSVPLVFVGY